MDQPIKAVTTVVRGVPRGKLSAGGGEPFDPHDDEVLWGYPFGGGDLFGDNSAWGVGTPLVVVHHSDHESLRRSPPTYPRPTTPFSLSPREHRYRVRPVP